MLKIILIFREESTTHLCLVIRPIFLRISSMLSKPLEIRNIYNFNYL